MDLDHKEIEMYRGKIKDLTAQNTELKQLLDSVLSEKEVAVKELESKIKVLQDKLDMSNSCCKSKSEENEELKRLVCRLETDVQHNREMYEDCKKTFETLYDGSVTIAQKLSDEKQKNNDLTNVITELTKTVRNLSEVI